MRSTLTMPISKGEAKSRFVEEYLNILLDYAEQLPTRWRWYDLVNMEYRNRDWLEELQVAEIADERISSSINNYRTVAGLNLIDNLLANVHQSVDLLRQIQDECKQEINDTDHLLQRFGCILDASDHEIDPCLIRLVSVAKDLRESAIARHEDTRRSVCDDLKAARRRLVNQVFISGAPDVFLAQFEPDLVGGLGPELEYALRLREDLKIDELRAKHSYIKEIYYKIISQRLCNITDQVTHMIDSSRF